VVAVVFVSRAGPASPGGLFVVVPEPAVVVGSRVTSMTVCVVVVGGGSVGFVTAGASAGGAGASAAVVVFTGARVLATMATGLCFVFLTTRAGFGAATVPPVATGCTTPASTGAGWVLGMSLA
jgi:hypothetical protein